MESLTKSLESLKIENQLLKSENVELKRRLASDANQVAPKGEDGLGDGEHLSDDAIRKQMGRMFKPRADGTHVTPSVELF